MSKGNRPRLLTTSRSERLLGSYRSYSNGGNHDITADDSSELGEEDVWSTVDNYDHYHMSNRSDSMREWGSFANNMSTRHSPHRDKDGYVGGLSLAFEDSGNTTMSTSGTTIVHQFRGHKTVANKQPRQIASSAPVNVPDWGKIVRTNSMESLHDEMNGGSGTFGEDERDSEMMPPHEYLARANSRNRKVSGVSVFEGVGRTLKGRDLRRVRDAVWSQTGFNG